VFGLVANQHDDVDNMTILQASMAVTFEMCSDKKMVATVKSAWIEAVEEFYTCPRRAAASKASLKLNASSQVCEGIVSCLPDRKH
jgi:hypothetical protein